MRLDSHSELVGLIDHTLLKPNARRQDVEQLCAEARQYGFYSVCVNSGFVELARTLLEDTEVKVGTVAGFPLGAVDADIKRYETEAAVDLGAAEIDVVIHIGRLKDGDDEYVRRELRDVVEAADERIVKVIIETCYLATEEKQRACRIASEAGAHFVKTSTGFGPSGATVEDVKLMREVVKDKLGVKAAGGIRDIDTALALLQAGANRLGTSASVSIMAGAANRDLKF